MPRGRQLLAEKIPATGTDRTRKELPGAVCEVRWALPSPLPQAQGWPFAVASLS